MEYVYPVQVKEYRDKLKNRPEFITAIRQRARDLEDLKTRRATRSQVLEPIDKYKFYVSQLRESVAAVRSLRAALPTEYFVPDERPDLLDRLDGDLLLAAMCADKAYDVLRLRRQTDPRTLRSDVLCNLLERLFVDLEGKPPTHTRSKGAGESRGTFPPFVEAVVKLRGLSATDGSAIVEYQRNRYRSKYAAVRNRKEMLKASQTASADGQQQAREFAAALVARNKTPNRRRKSLAGKSPK